MLTAMPAVAAYAGDVKKLLDITGAVWYVVCLPRGRGKNMRCQRKQDMRRGSTGGRLPFEELAFSIQMTLAAK